MQPPFLNLVALGPTNLREDKAKKTKGFSVQFHAVHAAVRRLIATTFWNSDRGLVGPGARS